MYTMDMHEDYEINEKDIDSALNYLKIHEPATATPERAIELIEFMREQAHLISHVDPANLEQVYKLFISKNN